MSRAKNSAINMFFGFFYQFLSVVLAFAVRIVFIRILSDEYLGINSLFTEILTMLSLADLGFNTAMVYSFYKPLAEDDKEKLSALITFYRKIYTIIAVTVAVVGLAITPFLDYIVNVEKPIPYLNIYYLFFLSNTVASYLCVYKTSIITADQRNHIIMRYKIIFTLFKSILQIVSLILFKNYFIYLGLETASVILINLFGSRKADKLYPHINEKRELKKEDRKSIVDNMKSIFIYKLSNVLMNGTDNVIISVIVGTVWVGFYSNYNMILNALRNFVNILFSSVTASVGNIMVLGDDKAQKKVFEFLQTANYIVSTFVIICLYVLVQECIGLFYGSRFELDYVVVIIILANFYLTIILQPVWCFREAAGIYVRTKYIMLIAAILNIVLSIIFAYIMGLGGVFLGSILSRVLTYVWYEPLILFNDYFHASPSSYFVSLVKNIIFTCITCFGVSYIVAWIPTPGILGFLIRAVACGCLALIVSVLGYSKSSGFKDIMGYVKSFTKAAKNRKAHS